MRHARSPVAIARLGQPLRLNLDGLAARQGSRQLEATHSSLEAHEHRGT